MNGQYADNKRSPFSSAALPTVPHLSPAALTPPRGRRAAREGWRWGCVSPAAPSPGSLGPWPETAVPAAAPPAPRRLRPEPSDVPGRTARVLRSRGAGPPGAPGTAGVLPMPCPWPSRRHAGRYLVHAQGAASVSQEREESGEGRRQQDGSA